MKGVLIGLMGVLTMMASQARAGVQTKEIEYKDGATTLRGYLAWDDSVQGKRPGVLVVHEWWGLNDYARGRARQLAGLGYVAFACDLFGHGKTTPDAGEAVELGG